MKDLKITYGNEKLLTELEQESRDVVKISNHLNRNLRVLLFFISWMLLIGILSCFFMWKWIGISPTLNIMTGCFILFLLVIRLRNLLWDKITDAVWDAKKSIEFEGKPYTDFEKRVFEIIQKENIKLNYE